jgi:excisionase family DNA binding protein
MELVTNTFLTVQQLAELLNLKVSWIYDRTRCTGSELIPHVRFGRQIRFHIESEDFQSWINAHAISVRAPIDSEQFAKYVRPR